MSTRSPWKFSCRAGDCHLRSTGCYETRILAHFCLQARISIVPSSSVQNIIGSSMGRPVKRTRFWRIGPINCPSPYGG